MIKAYILLALVSVAVGVVLTVLVLGISVRLGVSINENLWLLAIPTVLALILNVILLELYHRFWQKK